MTELREQADKAGVTAADLARLLGLTRVAVHHWFVGTHSPNRFLLPKVTKVFAAMAKAVAAGDLPLLVPPDGPTARTALIGQIITKHHKSP